MKSVKKKVPFIMQMEALECGAACLDMILAYFGKWVPLLDVRTQLGVSRDGLTMKSIKNGAEYYGLSCRAIRILPKGIAKNVQLPCIAYWDNRHFVVITGFSQKYVFINNPAGGPEKYTWEEFCKHYSNMLMMFEPTDTFVADGKRASVLSFARKRLRGARSAIAFTAIVGLLSAVLISASPLASQAFIDQVLANDNTSVMPYLLTMLAAVALMQFALGAAESSYTVSTAGRFDIEANVGFVGKLLRLPMNFYHQRGAGDLVNRQTSNTKVAITLMKTIAPLLVDAVSIVVYAILMFSISMPLAFIGIVTTLLNIIVASYISKKRISVSRVIARDSGSLSSTTSSMLNIMETIKSGGVEADYFRIWADTQASVVSGQTRIARLSAYLGSVPSLLVSLANVALLILGVILIMKGCFTAGGLVAMQSLVGLFMSPAQDLIGSGQTVAEMRTDMERIEDVMDYKDDTVFSMHCGEEGSFSQDSSPLYTSVELKVVSFGYSKQNPPILRDMSLSLKPGSTIAIVGGSGSGKSTLAKLVAGLYQPWSGEILYDGEPLLDCDRSIFTRSLSMVDQDNIIFDGTIEDAIRFGNPQATEEDIIRAAKDAAIHDTIMQRNGGYKQQIGDGAKSFSGGQRQQLEIARALAGNTPILVLDEATSALDAMTESHVMQAVKRRGAALLVVAHRLSTVRDADEIIVLDDGNIVERGTHKDLIANKGKYFELVSAF